ncbi:hypothetical protein [Paenibacillus rigui]|uniref:Uncharacterized protein n=1 Tax=Paenibacillus rigui TaxID=554312 RepID=A0A229UKS1_9BACL|nr:hypothetical protein [Paenibacillus rigui]OXM83996.1 hypothetical protein CF651_23070 [Paenibacillus rigui]
MKLIVEIRAVKTLDSEELVFLFYGTEDEQQSTIRCIEDEFVKYFKREGAEEVTASVRIEE